MKRYRLKLYVSGETPASRRAVGNLRRICAEVLHGNCDTQVIDILRDPQAAEDEKILATPTLIRLAPEPVRRLVGDLSDWMTVLRGLDLTAEQDVRAVRSPVAR